MNAFFWTRKKSSKDIVRAMDALLKEWMPCLEEDALVRQVDALSMSSAGSARNSAEQRERMESGDTENEAHEDGDSDDANSSGEEDASGVATTSTAVVAPPVTAPVPAGTTSTTESCSAPPVSMPLNELDMAEKQKLEKLKLTVPEKLEKHWDAIRRVFHGWREDGALQLAHERDARMQRVAGYLFRFHVFDKVLNPKVFGQLTFETRKYISQVFRVLSVHNCHNFVDFLVDSPHLLRWLAEGCGASGTALTCGSMLRDCFEHEVVVVLFLKEMQPQVQSLVEVTLNDPNFDVSADALLNLSRLFVSHKQQVQPVLEHQFEWLFGLLNQLLEHGNYATKRQTLQLLAEVLLDPINFSVMQRYVASRANLKLVMLLLREPSHALRMDAFHVFKIFVANPKKSPEVELLLRRNQPKLLAFVQDFGKNETNRDFFQEKSLLVFTLERLAEPRVVPQLARVQAKPSSVSESGPMDKAMDGSAASPSGSAPSPGSVAAAAAL